MDPPPRLTDRRTDVPSLLPKHHPHTEKWQNLLPDMVAKFDTRDLHIINGVLRSANAILKRFRCVREGLLACLF